MNGTPGYEGIHAMCGEKEYDENGIWTGASCMKSKGHDDRRRNLDPRRRAHFDLSLERVWGLSDSEAATS